MKKVIMVANTIYQMIVAVQLRLTILKDMAVDMVITDNSVDTEKYVESGKRSGLFDEIFYLKTREYCKRQGKYEKRDIVSELKFSVARFYEVQKRLKSRKRYDYLFTSNLDDFEMALYDVLRLRNKCIKLYLFEDGIATYKAAEKLIGSRKKDIEEGEFHKIYAVSNYGQALDRISGVFVFNPDLLDWNWNIKKYSIPKISKNDKKIIRILNSIFDYKSGCIHFDNKKVIFFEESFYGDGYRVNDVELLKVIEKCVGREQILIKLHPRNLKNRFEGYDIFEQTNMPWEILYLNNDFSDMILVAISSSCVIHPFLLFNDQKEMLVLQKIARLQIPATQKVNQEFIKRKIFLPYPKVFHMVENKEELESYLYKQVDKKNMWRMAMGQELQLVKNKTKLGQIFQKQIILYGAASGGRNFLSLLKLLGLNAEMFADSDPGKWEDTIEGIRIMSPDKCRKLMTNNHIIIITSIRCKEIKAELLKKGIPETQIYSKAAVELAVHFNLKSSGIADKFIERYYQEFQTYCRVKEHLMQVTDQRVFWECNFALLWKNPVMVYQPGKVGSMSVYESILRHGKNCVHIHQLMEMGKIYSRPEDWMKSLQNRQIKIITIVRDPIGREVSNFFYGMKSYLSQPHIIQNILDGGDLIAGCRQWMKEYSIPGKVLDGLSNVERVRYDTLYTQKYGSEFDWYDRELKSFTGIDIFSYPFDIEKGYSLIREGNYEILVLKLEKIKSLGSIIGEFCGISGFDLHTSNKTEDRAVSLIYEEAKKEMEIPQSVLDFYYGENERMHHFYSDEEINTFKKKWRG